jgi:hypothetical protein|tara:strand:+ start:281 stop:898 length:618 start_codon:yes stop_codon:yes gene_type:complete
MEKPSYYAILSAEVRYDERLKPMAKLMYAEITALCNMNGVCFAKNRYFSNLYNKGKGSISSYVNELVKYGYISTEYSYKIGTKEIDKRYIKIIKGGVAINQDTLLQKNEESNTIKINTNNSYNNIKRFKPPSLDLIINYCNERKNTIDAESFINFYESKGWMIGKAKMKNWKAAVRTWETRENKKPSTSKIDIQLNEYMKGKEYL